MGVNQSNYIIAGVKMDYDEFDKLITEKDECGDNPFEASYWEPEKLGFATLVDGMSGEYALAGHIICATGNDKYHFADDPVDLTLSKKKVAEIKKDLKKNLNIDAKEIKLFAVTHHT